MTRPTDPRQGLLDVDDTTPPPSLLEDPDITLGDLATVAYIERPTYSPTTTNRKRTPMTFPHQDTIDCHCPACEAYRFATTGQRDWDPDRAYIERAAVDAVTAAILDLDN